MGLLQSLFGNHRLLFGFYTVSMSRLVLGVGRALLCRGKLITIITMGVARLEQTSRKRRVGERTTFAAYGGGCTSTFALDLLLIFCPFPSTGQQCLMPVTGQGLGSHVC